MSRKIVGRLEGSRGGAAIAPAWAVPAALATRVALEAQALARRVSTAAALVQVLQEEKAEQQLLRKVVRAGGKGLAAAAERVLSHWIGRVRTERAGSRKAARAERAAGLPNEATSRTAPSRAAAKLSSPRGLAHSCLKAMTRSAGPAWRMPSIGVPVAATMRPESFHAWLDPPGSRPGKERAVAPDVAVAAFVAEHRLADFGGGEAVIALERACGRMGREPEMNVAAVLHTITLPTAVAAEGDHWFLVKAGRYWRPREVARAFGASDGSRFMAAVDSTELTPRQVVAALGRAVQGHVACAIVELCLTRGWLRPGFKYASACSGVDGFALGIEMLGDRAGDWQYVGASEKEPKRASLLVEAWAARGLRTESVATDARDPAGCAEAQPADLWVMTPNCEPWSTRNRLASTAERAQSMRDVREMLAHARAHGPSVVVVENVETAELFPVLSEVLVSALPGYRPFTQVIDSREHGGVPHDRKRRFWVLVRV
jgi:hypothetical protein